MLSKPTPADCGNNTSADTITIDVSHGIAIDTAELPFVDFEDRNPNLNWNANSKPQQHCCE